MMGGVFDKIHVKYGSFEMTVALLQRPSTLSLESLSYLLECLPSHFTSDIFWRHVDDEHDRVMEGSIPHYILTLLAWLQKHKKRDLHAIFMDSSFMHFHAYSSLMEESTWEGILMVAYQHMDRCMAKNMMRWLAQPLPYYVAVRGTFHLSHFSSKAKVHDEGGNYLCHVWHSLVFMISMLYQGGSFLLAHYFWLYLWSIAARKMAILWVVCGGKPHSFGVHLWHQILFS